MAENGPCEKLKAEKFAMNEAINIYNEKLDKQLLFAKCNFQQTRQNLCKVCSMTNFGGLMAWYDQQNTFADLESLLLQF